MDQVSIKRVKRATKKTRVEEKIIAGLGVGSALAGAGLMGGGVAAPTQIVSTNVSESAKAAKESIKKFFEIPAAKADEFGDDSGQPVGEQVQQRPERPDDRWDQYIRG